MKKLIVTKKYNNRKLNIFLRDNIPYLTEGLFYKTLNKKDIKINGQRISKNIHVFENDEIILYISDDLLEPNIKLDIIYEDSNILLINKPVNIEVTGNNSLTNIIHKQYANCGYLPMPCHRLDRNTRGLLLYAKNKETLEILLDKFKNHEIKKHYLALVYGNPKNKHQRIESYLFKDRQKSLVYISNTPKKGFSKIVTTYTLLKKYSNNTSLLDVEIETGKTHQIRAHLSHLGFPIIGDGKYGINQINKEMKAKYQKLVSYKLIFKFRDKGKLNYLNGKEFELTNVEVILK